MEKRTRPMLEAELRRNRAIGGGLSQAIDHVMCEREALAEALSELRTYCTENIAYFGEYGYTAELLAKVDAALKPLA